MFTETAWPHAVVACAIANASIRKEPTTSVSYHANACKMHLINPYTNPLVPSLKSFIVNSDALLI